MIKRFNEFILERLGIAEPSLVFVDFLSNFLYTDYLEFLDKKDDEEKGNYYFSWTLLKNHLDSDDKKLWEKFPIKEFKVNYIFEKNTEYDDKNIKMSVGGAMHEISPKENSKKSNIIRPRGLEKNYSISILMEITISTSDSYTTNDELKLLSEIRSLFSHELNHAYEGYRRIKINLPGTTELSSGYVNKKLNIDVSNTIDAYLGTVNLKNPDTDIISDELFNKWLEFTNLIYISEPHEVNAITQESLEFINTLELKESEIDKIPGWTQSKKMISFNSDEFYNVLLKLANNEVDSLDLLKDEFIKRLFTDYRNSKLLKYNDEGVEEYRSSHKLEVLEKLNSKDFINYLGKRINKSGQRLKRNIIRLFSYNK